MEKTLGNNRLIEVAAFVPLNIARAALVVAGLTVGYVGSKIAEAADEKSRALEFGGAYIKEQDKLSQINMTSDNFVL